jgi:hypothetical protein
MGFRENLIQFKVKIIIMSLLYISQQFTIYTGFGLLLAGIVGNGLNILILSTVHAYRTTPSTFYFLVGSIVNIIYILINLTTRILSVGYGIDYTNTSSILCKMRQFLLVTPAILSITLSCLAMIDQFLVTSRIVYLRRCSQIKWAHRIVFIAIIVWCLHGIPIILFFHISPISNTCTESNAAFDIYVIVYDLGIVCGIPALIMVVFGWLTYRNIHQIIVLAEQNADRQLVRMTLIQVGLVIISLIPYGIYSTYILITSSVTKDTDRQEKEYFAYTIVSMVTYFYYVVCLLILY